MGLTPRVTPRFKAAPTIVDGVRIEGRAPTAAKDEPKVEAMPPPPPPKVSRPSVGGGGALGGAEGHFANMRAKHTTALDYAKQALSAEQKSEGTLVEEEEESICHARYRGEIRRVCTGDRRGD